jgi:hypothetical protein
MRMDVAPHFFRGRMGPAFGDFFFERGHRLRRLGRGDHATCGVLVQQVENALGVFLVHHDFCGGLGCKCN